MNNHSTFFDSAQAENSQKDLKLNSVPRQSILSETRAESASCLSTSHISTPVLEAFEGGQNCVVPQVFFTLTGGLAKVIKGREVVENEDFERQPAKRGEIQTFSKKARRRMMRFLATTDQRKRPHFVTLTYPDVYPDVETVKAHLKNFSQRMTRLFPGSSFIWRAEVKERKSGEVSTGLYAPHFHLLVWGIDYKPLSSWIPIMWNQTVFADVAEWGGKMKDVKKESLKHFRVHSEPDKAVQALKSWKGVMRYASKYIAKLDETTDAEWQWKGKHWGIIGRENVPLSDVVFLEITQEKAVKITRIMRKMIKIKGRDLKYGITWFMAGREVERFLAWLLGGQDNPPKSLQLNGADARNLW